MNIAKVMAEEAAKEAAEREAWAAERYTGESCENCGRDRVEMLVNGKRVCEKCNWDQDAHTYSARPTRLWR